MKISREDIKPIVFFFLFFLVFIYGIYSVYIAGPRRDKAYIKENLWNLDKVAISVEKTYFDYGPFSAWTTDDSQRIYRILCNDGSVYYYRSPVWWGEGEFRPR